MINGLLNLSVLSIIITTLVMTHITVIGVTLYLHRCQAHKSLELHPAVMHFFRFWLWMTTGMTTKAWVAVHRKHHANVETKEDPHSPVVLGLSKVFFGGVPLYRKAKSVKADMDRYGKGTPEDWLETNVYERFTILPLLVTLLIDSLLFGIWGPIVWGVQMIWIPLFAAGVVNGVGHYWGYRNFESPDASTNIMPFGIIMGGEELHNNHHAFATSAKLSVKWWEFDIGWLYIRILSALGLARVLRSVPQLTFDPNKEQLDGDTLRAVVGHRLQVMDQYWRCVVKPALKEERRKADKTARRLFRSAQKLIVTEESIIDERQKDKLNNLLYGRKVLKTIYEFRLQLQDIWHRSTVNQSEMLDRLQKWCQDAEASGIRYLQDFVKRIKSYTPSPAPVSH